MYFPVQVKTEEQIAAEQAWYGSEKVWLVHKDGFSLGEFCVAKCFISRKSIHNMLPSGATDDY